MGLHLIDMEVKLFWQTVQTLERPGFGHCDPKAKEVKEAWSSAVNRSLFYLPHTRTCVSTLALLQWATSKDAAPTAFLKGSPASDPAVKARLKEVGRGRQADGLDEGRGDHRMVQLEQGHIIIVAVLLVIGVEEETDHLEGHLCVAAGVLEIFAQVNSPDGGRSQSVGCNREDNSSHKQRRMGRPLLLLSCSFKECHDGQSSPLEGFLLFGY